MSRLCIGLFLVASLVVTVLTAITAGLAYFHYVYGPTKLLEDETQGEWKSGLDGAECPTSPTKFHDLWVQPFFSTERQARIVHEHGVAVVNNILTKQTAHTLRQYLLERNQNGRQHVVEEPDHRHLILPSPKDPAVKEGLKEIGSHATLRPLLESLLGPSPSLLSLNAITSTYGSVDQEWHGDTTTYGSVDFVSEYIVGITLQDTTENMGATAVCPGTNKHGGWGVCELQDHKLEDAEQEVLDVVCPIRMVQSQGDGFLYNSDIFHKGRGHSDPDAPDRVVLFLTFAESKKRTGEKRILPLDTVHALELGSWGQTLDDMATLDERPWRPWHSIGLFNGHRGDIRPWTLIDAIAQIYADDDEEFYPFGNGSDTFDDDDAERWVLRLIAISLIGNVVFCYGIGVPCVVFWMFSSCSS